MSQYDKKSASDECLSFLRSTQEKLDLSIKIFEDEILEKYTDKMNQKRNTCAQNLDEKMKDLETAQETQEFEKIQKSERIQEYTVTNSQKHTFISNEEKRQQIQKPELSQKISTTTKQIIRNFRTGKQPIKKY